MATEKQKRRRGRKGDVKTRTDGSVKEVSYGASGYRPHLTPLVSAADETSQMWYEWGRNVDGRDDSACDSDTPLSSSQKSVLAKKYRSLADEIFRVELSLTGSSSAGVKSRSDERWVENTMKKGTLKDRIAATSVLISTDPIHKLSALDSLLGMAGCSDSGQSNRRVAQMAAEALEDLFLNTLLPPGRKLWTLEQRPLASYELSPTKTLSPRLLLLWRFEEILKEKYQSFVNGYLVATLRDGMDLNKTFALRIAGIMLRSTPEGEAQLLTMMVNKLGDPCRKISASAGHEIRRVLDEHENMQEIAAREVQQLAHRPHLSPRALYNCIVFLNQLKLRKGGGDIEAEGSQSLAVSLVNTYFRMFDVAMKKLSDTKHCTKSRLLSALLTGINRAHPFLPDRDQGLEEHVDSLYNVSHIAAPSASTQALMLLFHVAIGPRGETRPTAAQQSKQDRFFRALYAKLSKSSFLGGGKHLTLFFNLIYKTMKYDTNSVRVVSFAKKLMSTVLHANPAVAASSLFLLNEVMKTHKCLASSLNDVPEKESANLRLDPTMREPRAAVIDSERKPFDTTGTILPLWDVCLLSQHFHPSVAKFAASLGVIEYSGDPLRDFALAPFLDKFSYRNPKARRKGKISIAQRRIRSQVVVPVNEPAFLKKENVDDADKFFRNFFLERARRDDEKVVSRETSGEAGSDDELFDLLEEDQIERVFDDEGSTDSEEKAFVDKIASDLMDDLPSDSDINFDDEDPDMDDWDDARVNMNRNSSDIGLCEDLSAHIDSSDDPASHADGDDFTNASDSDEENCLFSMNDEDGTAGTGERRRRSETMHEIDSDVFADADEYAKLINNGDASTASSTNLRSKVKLKRKRGMP